MAARDIAVVYLARGLGGGSAAANDFFASYATHDAGINHRLVIVAKGWESDPEGLESVRRRAGELDGHVHLLADDGYDWGAYFRIARTLDESLLCLLNTHSRIRRARWLELLAEAAVHQGIGAAGATGSWESSYHNVAVQRPRGFVERATHFPRLAFNALRYPDFPNPHLRSNAFVTSRATLLEFARKAAVPRHKRDAQALESGRHGYSAFLRERRLGVVVVGADGRTYGSADWIHSGTFRVSGHPNLLVADNQTQAFDAADSLRQAELSHAAWGSGQAR